MFASSHSDALLFQFFTVLLLFHETASQCTRHGYVTYWPTTEDAAQRLTAATNLTESVEVVEKLNGRDSTRQRWTLRFYECELIYYTLSTWTTYPCNVDEDCQAFLQRNRSRDDSQVELVLDEGQPITDFNDPRLFTYNFETASSGRFTATASLDKDQGNPTILDLNRQLQFIEGRNVWLFPPQQDYKGMTLSPFLAQLKECILYNDELKAQHGLETDVILTFVNNNNADGTTRDVSIDTASAFEIARECGRIAKRQSSEEPECPPLPPTPPPPSQVSPPSVSSSCLCGGERCSCQLEILQYVVSTEGIPEPTFEAIIVRVSETNFYLDALDLDRPDSDEIVFEGTGSNILNNAAHSAMIFREFPITRPQHPIIRTQSGMDVTVQTHVDRRSFRVNTFGDGSQEFESILQPGNILGFLYESSSDSYRLIITDREQAFVALDSFRSEVGPSNTGWLILRFNMDLPPPTGWSRDCPDGVCFLVPIPS